MARGLGWGAVRALSGRKHRHVLIGPGARPLIGYPSNGSRPFPPTSSSLGIQTFGVTRLGDGRRPTQEDHWSLPP